MPLSEKEQRILAEIERSLYEEDPTFARQVQRRAPRMAERRRVKLGIFSFLAGFGLLIAFFVSGLVIVGVGAFGSMVGGIVLIAGSLRASLSPRRPTGPKVAERIAGSMKSWEEKMRDRYKRQ